MFTFNDWTKGLEVDSRLFNLIYRLDFLNKSEFILLVMVEKSKSILGCLKLITVTAYGVPENPILKFLHLPSLQKMRAIAAFFLAAFTKNAAIADL